MEIEECVEAINSDVVMQEVDVRPSCITKHPGFVNLCLDKWSLRFAATNLKLEINSNIVKQAQKTGKQSFSVAQI